VSKRKLYLTGQQGETMKAIFDAIRAAKDLRKSDEGYHLQAFELRNRGHQNQLDDLALELMTKPLYHFTPWGAFRTRVDTLQDSLRALLQGLTAFVPAHATHRADWQSILSATDSTGLMLRTTRGLIQDWATYGTYREFGTLRIERYASELKDGVLKLNLSLCDRPSRRTEGSAPAEHRCTRDRHLAGLFAAVCGGRGGYFGVAQIRIDLA